MDFFKLSQTEYKNYLSTVRSLMAENNFQHEGIAFFVISSMPELENMAKQKALTKSELSLEVYEKFCKSYCNAEKIFTTRFRMFFEHCVKDEILFSPLMRSLGMVEEYVAAFILADEKQFANIYERTASSNVYDNMEEFAKLLNTQSFDISKAVEECRESCYY
jgi:hypothetical protein